MESLRGSSDGLTFRIPLSGRDRSIGARDGGARAAEDRGIASGSLRVYIPASRPVATVSRNPQSGQPTPAFSRARENAPPVLSDEELANIDLQGPQIPSQEKVHQLAASAVTTLEQLEVVAPCAVCEMAFASGEVIPVQLSELLLKAMKLLLKPDPSRNISKHVLRQYDATTIDSRLSGLLLYPPGVSSVEGRVRLSLCALCHDCLNKKNPTLPRMAIANGNYIGWYDGEPLTWLNEQMIALVSACVSMTSIAGGRQRCIRSHHYIVKNTQGPPISMLPEHVPNRIRVALVGAMTPDQIVKCRKRYAIDVAQCKVALEFLCKEHTSYQSYQVQRAAASRLARADQVDVVVDRTASSADPADSGDVDDMENTTSYAIPDSTSSAHPDLETQWIEERTVLLDDTTQASDFFFRKSNVFDSSTRWESAVQMFPLLFPGGKGGPCEPRKQQYSLHTWVNRCLRLHGSRFEKHEVFLLLAFDYLAQEAARKRMYIRLKASTDAVAAGRVTASVVKECIEYRRHLEEASAKGVEPRPPSEAISSVLKLQRGVNAGQVGYYGSDKSRTHARNDIFGYISRFGPLQLFFTISPDSAGTYAISCRSGFLDRSTIARANAHLMPTRTERRATATMHPFQCAIYFNKVMSIIIEDILGWSTQHQRPKRGGGLFGVVRAFAASTETQVSGDLHGHFAVWLHGFPASASATEEALKEPAYREGLAKFVDSITTASMRGMLDRCLDTSCQGTIEPVAITDDAYQKPKRGGRACSVGICTLCKTEYSSQQLVDTLIREEITGSEADYIRCRSPSQAPLTDEELNVIVRDVQIHRWYHSKSCFKVTRSNPTGTYCRFQRPVPPNPNPTFVNDAQEVVHHRPLGSEYVNPYNETLTRLFRCNHDIRLVLSSTSKDVAAYICKYVMKPQNRVENETALALATYEHAVDSANSKTTVDEASDQERGNSIFASWLYHLTNHQDIAASLAALYILRESAFWFSHDVSRIHLGQLLTTFETLASEDATVQVSPEVLVRDTPVYVYVNALQHYWARPASMEALCLVDVIEWFDLKAGQYTKRDTRQILVLCGKALPDIQVCTDQDERHRYFKTLLMLFKPSRRDHLHDETTTYEQAYEDFVANGPERPVALAQDHVRRVSDSHTARRASAENEDVLHGQLGAHYSSMTGLAADRPEEEEIDEEADEINASLPFSIPTVDQQSDRYDQVLGADGDITQAVLQTARQQLAGFDENKHRVFSNATSTRTNPIPEDQDRHGTTMFIRTYCTRESQMNRLEAYINPIPWQDPNLEPEINLDSLSDFATIGDISRAFRLNPLQHYAFETTARHVLYAFARNIADEAGLELPEPPLSSGLKKQFIGFLGGEAGTGKSQVIHALLLFAKLWRREGSIEALAYTGVAANNINGRTVHSARNIPISSEKRPNVSEEMRTKFGKVVLTICDEISMLAQTLLGRADAATNELVSPDLEARWGGRHILFCGDWLQIPPVRGRPCYSKPPTSQSRFSTLGYKLYSSINFVVFLMENMRNRFDAAYTAMLSRVRWGRITSEDLKVFNTRVGQTAARDVSEPWYFHPAIVPTNQQRCAINHKMTFETAAAHGARIYECRAVPTSTQSAARLPKVQHLDDTCTDRMPLKLLYFFGMPAMLSQRSKPSLHATANGTLAFIAGHEQNNNGNPGTLEERNGCTVLVLHQMPKRLILKIPASDTQYDPALPPGFLYIEPISKSLNVDVPRTSTQSHITRKRPRQQPLTLTIRQFAIVPAFACTPEKLQGLTCHDGVTLLKLNRSKIPTQSLYVALSRTTTLSKLVLTHDLDAAYVAKFRPDPRAVTEIQRLLLKMCFPAYFSHQQRSNIAAWMLTQTIQTQSA